MTLTLKFHLIFKNLTLVITYKPREIGLSYFTCVFLVTRPFTSYHNFLPSDLDLEVRPTFPHNIKQLYTIQTQSATYGIPEGTSTLFTIYYFLLRFTFYHLLFYLLLHAILRFTIYHFLFTTYFLTSYHLNFIIYHFQSTFIYIMFYLLPPSIQYLPSWFYYLPFSIFFYFYLLPSSI